MCRGESRVWTIKHSKMRRELCTPYGMPGSPDSGLKLKASRTTTGVSREGQHFQINESWKDPQEAHKQLGFDWTGQTTFVEKHQGDRRVVDELSTQIVNKVTFLGSMMKADKKVPSDQFEIGDDENGEYVDGSEYVSRGVCASDLSSANKKETFFQNGVFDEHYSAEVGERRLDQVAQEENVRRAQCAGVRQRQSGGSKKGGSKGERSGADGGLGPRVGGGERVLLTTTVPAARRDVAGPSGAPVRRGAGGATGLISPLSLHCELRGSVW